MNLRHVMEPHCVVFGGLSMKPVYVEHNLLLLNGGQRRSVHWALRKNMSIGKTLANSENIFIAWTCALQTLNGSKPKEHTNVALMTTDIDICFKGT